MNRDVETEAKAETGERPDHPPRVADALKSGVSVSVTSWSGRQLRGTVSDRDEAGLLLDLDDRADGQEGYAFLPVVQRGEGGHTRGGPPPRKAPAGLTVQTGMRASAGARWVS